MRDKLENAGNNVKNNKSIKDRNRLHKYIDFQCYLQSVSLAFCVRKMLKDDEMLMLM